MDEAVVEGEDPFLKKLNIIPRHALTSTLALPQGTTFLSVENFGTSAWTITGRVVAMEPNGTEKPYFLKVCSTIVPFTGHSGWDANKAGL